MTGNLTDRDRDLNRIIQEIEMTNILTKENPENGIKNESFAYCEIYEILYRGKCLDEHTHKDIDDTLSKIADIVMEADIEEDVLVDDEDILELQIETYNNIKSLLLG